MIDRNLGWLGNKLEQQIRRTTALDDLPLNVVAHRSHCLQSAKQLQQDMEKLLHQFQAIVSENHEESE